MNNRCNLANQFQNIFERVLAREKLDFCNAEVSLMFEVIATNLLSETPERKDVYFDGAVNITSTLKKTRQVEFRGEMWVGGNQTQWKELFRAVATDKRITKQGIWITIWVGSDKAEGDLSAAFGIVEATTTTS
jgi:hypothetical protein